MTQVSSELNECRLHWMAALLKLHVVFVCLWQRRAISAALCCSNHHCSTCMLHTFHCSPSLLLRHPNQQQTTSRVWNLLTKMCCPQCHSMMTMAAVASGWQQRRLCRQQWHAHGRLQPVGSSALSLLLLLQGQEAQGGRGEGGVVEGRRRGAAAADVQGSGWWQLSPTRWVSCSLGACCNKRVRGVN